jgi:hypothetical protein
MLQYCLCPFAASMQRHTAPGYGCTLCSTTLLLLLLLLMCPQPTVVRKCHPLLPSYSSPLTLLLLLLLLLLCQIPSCSGAQVPPAAARAAVPRWHQRVQGLRGASAQDDPHTGPQAAAGEPVWHILNCDFK